MNLADFTRLVDAYGADLNRWPQQWRSAALDLARSDPAAEAALGEARILDDVLDAAPIQAPSVVLRTGLAAAALGGGSLPHRARRSGRDTLFGRRSPSRWAAAAALAAACAAGAVTGVAAATRQVQPARMGVSADPAAMAARVLADPMDAEG